MKSIYCLYIECGDDATYSNSVAASYSTNYNQLADIAEKINRTNGKGTAYVSEIKVLNTSLTLNEIDAIYKQFRLSK